MKIKLSAKTKVGIIVLVTGLVLTLGVGLIVHRLMYRQAIDRYTEVVFNSAHMATSIIDADRIEYYLLYGADETYYTAVNLLRELKIANDLTFLYIAMPDGNNNIVYVFDIYTYRSDLDLISRLGDIAGEEDVIVDVFMDVFTTGRTLDGPLRSRTEFGYLASAYVPVFASDGRVVAVACADIDMDALLRYVLHQTIMVSLIVLVVFLISSIIILVFYTKDLSAGERAAVERERVVTELDVAKNIQMRMLPSVSSIPNRNEFDIFAYMEPKRGVGGDFYDFFFIDDNILAVVIGDVSDKGVPAALFMSSTMMLIKNIARLLWDSNGEHAPHKVYDAVNNALYEKRTTMFVTSFMGYLDLTNGEFTYVNAGHNPPLIKRNDDEGFNLLEVEPGFVLAGTRNFKYDKNVITLSPGDTMCLYTDGITDAVNKDKEAFLEEGLMAAANSYKGQYAQELVNTIKNQLADFTAGAEQKDDIAMLAFKYTDKG